MIEEKKRYIAPGGWFAMEYPAVWSEFEDSTDAFLFYNPDKWTGNFRISAFRNEIPNKKGIHYGDDACNVELKENKSAEYVKIDLRYNGSGDDIECARLLASMLVPSGKLGGTFVTLKKAD